MSSAHTWSIAKDQNLVSIPSEKDNHPSTEYPSPTNEFYMEHAQKLQEVRSVLKEVGEDTLEALLMIDAIQRLGIDYHFHGEIEVVLQRLHTKFNTVSDCHNNLYELALGFRLLRQEGYYVSADVFNNLKDTEGKLQEKLSEDIKGLMGLYEASQLCIKGEDILEEIGNFSSQLLNAWNTHNDHSQARIVRNTLGHPHHKSLARFMAKSFLSDFQGTDGWVNVFRELAKMDFNVVKSIHQKEMLQMVERSRFGQGVEVCKKPTTEMVHVALGGPPDPSLSEQRVELTKPISIVYIIDDIFDVHGTLDELTLFTEAVNRWEYAAVEQLPDYMKICFNALNGITNEISSKVYNDHGWNPMESLRKAWACLCNAFLVEAKWFADGHVPKADEYLKNGVISSGVHVVLVHVFFLLGHCITKRNVDIVDDFPEIISSVAKILRLWDDLGSAKDENQDGHDGSYLECYMKEKPGTSIENARCHVMHTISETWKSLSNECLAPNPFSTCFTNACLNVARMVPLMYSYDDNRASQALKST
ncbi:(3S,6E)-nerolidol synthase 1, chloroplastic [Vitis vinifera]|uniref:(3S,6E)-nerolidol synthase 1, chloroplastic n=1 Tax=Vitis vinifera TaxID=29760 RepID=A0A438FFG3_VITVI|nr:(3S,6E)-nerolidol synthase 1, chloroplastic [Vitis vinifera]